VEIFVYGTLTDHDTAASVLDEFEYRGPAAVEGLHRVDGRYPTLAPGGAVDGRLLVTEQVGALDRYEGVDDGLYVRISIPRGSDDIAAPRRGTDESVQMYVGAPGRLGVADEWPGEGPFGERVRRYVDEHEIVVRKIDR
jgi:gamma-glutamylaminecyclotransferase